MRKRLRFAVLKRDGFACQYCGRKAPEVTLEIDHKIPVSRGGTDRLVNLVTACRDCNRGKYTWNAEPSTTREALRTGEAYRSKIYEVINQGADDGADYLRELWEIEWGNGAYWEEEKIFRHARQVGTLAILGFMPFVVTIAKNQKRGAKWAFLRLCECCQEMSGNIAAKQEKLYAEQTSGPWRKFAA